MPQPSELQGAALQDIPMSALQESLENIRARTSSLCDAEYGNRVDDGALVLHFFPPGYGDDTAQRWKEGGWASFIERLEPAMESCFARYRYDAGYVPELQSFCLTVLGITSPDRNALIEEFFRVLESPR